VITTFIRHAKDFCSRNPAKPLFQCVMFNGQQAFATDSYLCVAVPFVSGVCNINLMSGEVIEGSQPDWIKTMPINFSGSIDFNTHDINSWINALKAAQIVYGKYDMKCCSIDGCKLSVEHEGSKFEASLLGNIEGDVHIKVQIKYMLDVLKFFADLVGPADVKIRDSGDGRIFVIEHSSGAVAIISEVLCQK
jgi:hypothetical protein